MVTDFLLTTVIVFVRAYLSVHLGKICNLQTYFRGIYYIFSTCKYLNLEKKAVSVEKQQHRNKKIRKIYEKNKKNKKIWNKENRKEIAYGGKVE